MSRIIFLLSCLVFGSYGRRVQQARSPESPEQTDAAEALAALLLASKHAAGFAPTSQGARVATGIPKRTSSRSPVMQEEEKPARRRDIDGGIFTAKEFEDYYQEGWEEKWEAAEPADDIKLLSELKVGDTFEEAEVLRYTNFGAFMDIGAEVDGLCHYTKIPAETWDTLDNGHTLKVTIDNIDEEKRQVGLTTGTPGERIRDDIKLITELKVGDVFEEAEVQRYADFGAFMDIKAEVNALCHISKIPPEVWETLDTGSTMKVTIERIDLEKKQISLTAKEPGRPLSDLQVGEVVEGTVIKLMPFGAFVEFGAEANGLVHVSEIADEFISDVSEKLSEGEKIQAKIKEVDVDRRRIGLSIKDMGGGGDAGEAGEESYE
mmetsp:Transcript_79816/g.139224  ORF Transcript_79816/g.139224 Transcript_79816/m.139224 type:complete len:377 (+) Transcript_79816:76-1206(+)